MPNSPSFVLGRRLDPTQPYKPGIQRVLNTDHSHTTVSVVPSPRITKFAGKSFSFSTQKRPFSACTYSQSIKHKTKRKEPALSRALSVSYGLHTEFFSVFNPIDISEKPRWLNSARSGTIYEDHRQKTSRLHETKQRLKTKIIGALQDCYDEIEHEEIRKHETRLRILYRFRLRRLENSLKSQHFRILQQKPIIFTPELGDDINPFNPSIAEIEAHTKNRSRRIEELARPRFSYQVETPRLVDLQEPEIQRMMHSIHDLKNIRDQYHWRSFVHRTGAHYDEMNDNASQATVDTVDTVSTCSEPSGVEIDRYRAHCVEQSVQMNSNSNTEKQRKGEEKLRKECLEEIKQFEHKLNYLQRKTKHKKS